MTDLGSTIAPKSDQLNADDLVTGPRTITITSVKSCPGGASDQPIAMHFDGDNGKPYKPCKTMRRLMVNLWGADGSAYPGRSLMLYRDPDVKWGGIKVGGIRISHMTHIDADTQVVITESKTSRIPKIIKKLVVETKPTKEPGDIDQALARIKNVANKESLDLILNALRDKSWTKEQGQQIAEAKEDALAELAGNVSP